jgi:hypothetical protein
MVQLLRTVGFIENSGVVEVELTRHMYGHGEGANAFQSLLHALLAFYLFKTLDGCGLHTFLILAGYAITGFVRVLGLCGNPLLLKFRISQLGFANRLILNSP